MSTENINKKLEELEKELNKKEDNLVKVRISYTDYVLPYNHAIKLVEALRNAEQIDKTDYKNPRIIPIEDNIEIFIISKNTYDLMKLSTLLNIPYLDLVEQQKKETYSGTNE